MDSEIRGGGGMAHAGWRYEMADTGGGGGNVRW